MNISITPILQSLRDIYDIEGIMPRFQAYLSLMLGDTRGEAFPLGVFSPMGKRQSGYLDNLIALEAESIAEKAAAEAAAKLSAVSSTYRLLLVVADVARNGWTQRYLTDAEWRLQNKYDAMPQNARPINFDRWVTVQLWTDEEPNAAYISRETQATIYRAAYRERIGIPKTLAEMMHQEGRAMAFAGYSPTLNEEDIAYSRQIIEPFRQSNDYPVCFTALYGDEIAKAVGYQGLGLSKMAGFDVGLDEEKISLHKRKRPWEIF
ncbi:MAG: hypothetical protein ACRBF0_23135 [Calditrichia bacterium]